MKKSLHNPQAASLLLRTGLVIVFLYAATSSLQHPLDWVGFLPTFLTQHVAATTLLKIFGVYELVLCIWLVSGKFLRYSALLCALTLIGIVVTNPSQLITTFRDIGLACMAVALALLEK